VTIRSGKCAQGLKTLSSCTGTWKSIREILNSSGPSIVGGTWLSDDISHLVNQRGRTLFSQVVK
jgi:hypothetical protein